MRVKSSTMEPIAIIGMACRFPGADNPAAFWQLLRDGVDAIAEVPPERFDVDFLAVEEVDEYGRYDQEEKGPGVPGREQGAPGADSVLDGFHRAPVSHTGIHNVTHSLARERGQSERHGENVACPEYGRRPDKEDGIAE